MGFVLISFLSTELTSDFRRILVELRMHQFVIEEYCLIYLLQSYRKSKVHKDENNMSQNN